MLVMVEVLANLFYISSSVSAPQHLHNSFEEKTHVALIIAQLHGVDRQSSCVDLSEYTNICSGLSIGMVTMSSCVFSVSALQYATLGVSHNMPSTSDRRQALPCAIFAYVGRWVPVRSSIFCLSRQHARLSASSISFPA